MVHSDLEAALVEWKAWDDLMAVQNHEIVKVYLVQMFKYYLQGVSSTYYG